MKWSRKTSASALKLYLDFPTQRLLLVVVSRSLCYQNTIVPHSTHTMHYACRNVLLLYLLHLFEGYITMINQPSTKM